MIAVIDADLIGRKNHRFPNLAVMKLAAYHKSTGEDVVLKTDYDSLGDYDKVFISKVFTDTEVPEGILSMPNVEYGGTGFYFDKAPPLPPEIEHIMPDYHIYDEWLLPQLNDKTKVALKYYTDYSIGFLTRGCFRQCGFCVNQKYRRVKEHSPLEEFYDPTRKKICLLDDNFFGCPNWKPLLQQLIDTGKRFVFHQGLDERLLTPEKCEMLFSAKYDDAYRFAFDDIADAPLIEEKLKMIRRHTKTTKIMFYVLVGYDRNGKYDEAFWQQDLLDMFTRIEILGRYACRPYIMRYSLYDESPYRGVYITVASWCNTFSLFEKMTLHQFCDARAAINRTAPRIYMEDAIFALPEISQNYDKHFYNKEGLWSLLEK